MQAIGVGLVVLAAFFWGVSGGLAGILMERGWEPLVISFYRGALGLACLAAWLVVHPGSHRPANRRMVWWSIAAGIGVTGNFTFYFISIGEASVAVAATLMYTAPVYVYLVSIAVGIERASTLKSLAVIAVLTGIVLLTGLTDGNASNVTATGVAAGLASGLSYALFIFGFRYASAESSAETALSIGLLTLTALLLPLIDREQAVAVLFSPDLYLFVLLGLFGAGVSFVLYIVGLRMTSPAIASIVAMIEPVTAATFGFVVLSQSLGMTQLAGMALIVATAGALSTARK